MDIKSILMGKCRGTLSDLPSYLMGNGSGTGYTRTDLERKFTRSVSAGSASIKPHGRAIIKTVRGNTVTWNQFIPVQPASKNTPGLTVTYLSDGIKVTGTATARGYFYFTGDPNTATVTGHTFFRSAYAEGTVSGDWYLADASSSNSVGGARASERVYTQTATTNKYPLFVISDGAVVDAVFRLNMIDLTVMFGAGNEPATVEEFRAMFPNEYYAFSKPTLLSFVGNGIKSYDTSGNIIGSCTIPTAANFADGMKSAGTVYDELLPNKAIKRIGAVDLGTLNWSYSSASAYFSASLPSMASHGTTTKGKLRAIGYSAATFSSMYNHPEGDDLVMAQSNGSNHYLYIRNKAYTVASDFKTAMSGVMLYYELAEPIETAIDPPLNLSYIVDNGGEEEVTSAAFSSPLDATINYAVDDSAPLPPPRMMMAPPRDEQEQGEENETELY